MGKKLIVLGHGKSRNGAYDSGAVGNDTSEAVWLRGDFMQSLKKYAAGRVDIYTGNMYGNRDADHIRGYSEVIDLHLDAAAPNVTGGHVIIHKNYKPDAMDERLAETIDKHFGLRGGRAFDYRNNLYNLNVFARRGIAYRLLELGFITNKKNMDHFKKNADQIAKDIVEDILNAPAVSSPKPSIEKPDVYTVKAGDTLWAIAAANGVRVANLKSWNALKSDLIIVGQEIRIGGSEDPQPAPEAEPTKAPVAKESKEFVLLPRSAKTWRTYKLGVQPVTKNSDWSLTPAAFGGLEYQVLDRPFPDVVTIKTSRGKRNIYAAQSTGARILKK